MATPTPPRFHKPKSYIFKIIFKNISITKNCLVEYKNICMDYPFSTYTKLFENLTPDTQTHMWKFCLRTKLMVP